jgi:hypothetical protein
VLVLFAAIFVDMPVEMIPDGKMLVDLFLQAMNTPLRFVVAKNSGAGRVSDENGWLQVACLLRIFSQCLWRGVKVCCAEACEG